MDTLAREYEDAGRPVLFIETDKADTRSNRVDRWYDAYDQQRDCGVPLVTVDSGFRWTCGFESFEAVYSTLVNQAMGSPPGVDLAGYYTRAGSDLDVWLQVTNRSGRALGPGNYATANAIVVERTKVLNTDRYARAAAAVPFERDLADGSQGSYALQLFDVPVASWDRAVIVVLVDYRPDSSSTHYESLQAAIATEYVPPTATATPTATSPPTATPTASATSPATVTPVATAPPAASATPTEPATYLPLVLARPR